jgi:hypothetical protein
MGDTSDSFSTWLCFFPLPTHRLATTKRLFRALPHENASHSMHGKSAERPASPVKLRTYVGSRWRGVWFCSWMSTVDWDCHNRAIERLHWYIVVIGHPYIPSELSFSSKLGNSDNTHASNLQRHNVKSWIQRLKTSETQQCHCNCPNIGLTDTLHVLWEASVGPDSAIHQCVRSYNPLKYKWNRTKILGRKKSTLGFGLVVNVSEDWEDTGVISVKTHKQHSRSIFILMFPFCQQNK